MSIQFVHLQAYSRKGDREGRSTSYVFAEARRDPASSLHVPNPMPPTVVYGIGITELEEIHDAAAEAARTLPKAGKPRRIRTDQQTLMTVVASHPHLVSDIADDERKLAEIAIWENLTIKWLQQLYGDQLASVIRHTDEPHFHLHAYILPESSTMRASALHPGQCAKNEVMSNAGNGDDPKTLNKRGDAAYRQAMRDWQDSYHGAVGVHCGLTRLGPARRRLTRAEWQAERTQARALQVASNRARDVEAQVDTFVVNMKEKTEALVREADANAARVQADATAALEKVAEANAGLEHRTREVTQATEKAQAIGRRALEEQRKARSMIGRVREEAAQVREATARLQRLPSFLRSLWDGFRISTIQDRARSMVEAELKRLRSMVTASEERAGKAETATRTAEEKARHFERSLSATMAQRDIAWKELERVRPTPPSHDDRLSPQPRPRFRS